MSAPESSVAQAYPGATTAGRHAAAIVVAGVIAALVWMFVLQEGHTGRIFGATWTQHDFPDGLGKAFGASDTSRTGMFLTLGLGVIVAAIFAIVERRLPGRGLAKGLWFAGLLFLAWGLVFTPLVNSRQVQVGAEYVFLPTGLFGVDAGSKTIISGAVASLVAGLIVARIIPLMRDATWWQAHPDVGHGLASEETAAELLELAEKGAEQGGERAR